MIISSYFPGHIRIRDRILKDPDIAQALTALGTAQSYVHHLQINPTSCSILIEYDPQRLPIARIASMRDLLLHAKELCDFYTPRKKEEILQIIAQLGKELGG